MFTRNIGNKQRIVRVVGGGLMILCGLVGLGATPLGFAVACMGLVSLITGIVRYCPACAMAGHKAVEGSCK